MKHGISSDASPQTPKPASAAWATKSSTQVPSIWSPKATFSAFWGVVAAAWLVTAPSPAVAEGWSWRVTPYAWATSTTVDVEVNDRELIEGTVDFADLIDDADFAAMIRLEAQKQKLGVFFDILAADLGDEPRSVRLGPRVVSAESDLEMTIADLGAIYNPSGDGTGFSLLFGARVIDVDQEIDLFLPESFGGEQRIVDASGTAYDGLIGARYTARFADAWSLSIWGDFSTGDTESTWNAAAVLGYRFGAEDDLVVHLGYRHMAIELDEQDRLAEVETEIAFSGPLLGLSWLF